MEKNDWLLTASLNDEVAARLGMEEISKLYEETTVVEAFTNFLVALEDNGVTEADCGLLAIEPAAPAGTVTDWPAVVCKVCGGRALDFQCPECGR